MSGKVVPINTRLVGAEKATHTKLELMEITEALLDTWRPAPFQRPLKVNQKVLDVSLEIKADSVVPGIITIGIFNERTYILDGQHRLHAFKLAGIASAYADVRIHHFDTLGAMGEEFVRLNSQLVQLRPDDILRGLEAGTPSLKTIRDGCPFVGYDMIRRNEKAPLLSMSAVIRAWRASAAEVPQSSGQSAHYIASTMLPEEAEQLVAFLTLAYRAWGRDAEYIRLWGALNLTLCMWLYRRVVLEAAQPGKGRGRGWRRYTHFGKGLFEKAMMSLSADGLYLDWLLGRTLRERDRSPCYSRIRNVIARRYHEDVKEKPKLPQPAWSTTH